MKKVFISILLFYLIVHFIVPGIYFSFVGSYNTYTNIDDKQAVLQGFILNAVTILGTIVVVYFLPTKKEKKLIFPKFYNLTPLYYFSIFLFIVFFFLGGGFEGKITGNSLGSLFNYIAFFFNPFIILLCILFYQRKPFNIIFLCLIYLIYATVTGSRSGFISLFIIFLMYPAFSNYQVYKKSIKKLLIFLLFFTPFLFLAATIFIRKSNIQLDSSFIAKMIMGRLSFLETSMLPIHYKNLDDPLYIFYDKYGLINQIKLIIDSLFPGNFFGNDVMPNQYYRAAFMGYPVPFVISVYTSINITLPVYLYMYFGGIVSCLIGIGILVLYYKLIVKSVNNIYLLLPLLASLYHLLYFFDWVMWFIQFFTFLLTSLAVYAFAITRKSLVEIIKQDPVQLQKEN